MAFDLFIVLERSDCVGARKGNVTTLGRQDGKLIKVELLTCSLYKWREEMIRKDWNCYLTRNYYTSKSEFRDRSDRYR